MKQLFEVTLQRGLGKPIYVDADTVDEAKKLALGIFRKQLTAMDNRSIDECIKEAKPSDKIAVQYD